MWEFNGSSLVAVAAVVLMSGSAFALSSVHSFTGGAITGLGTDGTIVGNRLGDYAIGDQFEVAITLDNSSGDDIFSVFTFLQYDNSVINIVNGFADTASFPAEPGFGGNTVVALGAPADAAGQPAGTAVAIALGVNNPGAQDGLYSAPNSGTVAIAIFEIVGLGFTEIVHVDTGSTRFNGRLQSPTFSAPILVGMPEPSAALLIGLGLSGLAFRGRHRA